MVRTDHPSTGMRRRRFALTAFAFGAIVTAEPAVAQPDGTRITSANYLMPGCRGVLSPSKANPDPYLEGWCLGAIDGIIFMGGGNSICLPTNAIVTYEQSARVVVTYIEARPQRMHESFKKLALEALMEAWPCKAPRQ
jgi:hypothetical protein